MRSYIAGAVLAAAFVLAPVATGYAPALAQDFSITKQGSLQIEGADLSPDWIRKLQAFWDLHAYYPKEASDKDESGTVKLDLRIHSDGQVWWAKVVESSGSKSIDDAAFVVFSKTIPSEVPAGHAGAGIRCLFRWGTKLGEADLFISLHYVLAHRHDQPVNASTAPALSKQPFTITNGPVKDTVIETTLQRTCSGTVHTSEFGDTPPDSIFGHIYQVTTVFYRKPDGAPWVKFTYIGGTVSYLPVTELGVSAQWRYTYSYGKRMYPPGHYAVWPDGDNHLIGRTIDGPGTIDLTCESVTLPLITSGSWMQLVAKSIFVLSFRLYCQTACEMRVAPLPQLLPQGLPYSHIAKHAARYWTFFPLPLREGSRPLRPVPAWYVFLPCSPASHGCHPLPQPPSTRGGGRKRQCYKAHSGKSRGLNRWPSPQPRALMGIKGATAPLPPEAACACGARVSATAQQHSVAKTPDTQVFHPGYVDAYSIEGTMTEPNSLPGLRSLYDSSLGPYLAAQDAQVWTTRRNRWLVLVVGLALAGGVLDWAVRSGSQGEVRPAIAFGLAVVSIGFFLISKDALAHLVQDLHVMAQVAPLLHLRFEAHPKDLDANRFEILGIAHCSSVIINDRLSGEIGGLAVDMMTAKLTNTTTSGAGSDARTHTTVRFTGVLMRLDDPAPPAVRFRLDPAGGVVARRHAARGNDYDPRRRPASDAGRNPGAAGGDPGGGADHPDRRRRVRRAVRTACRGARRGGGAGAAGWQERAPRCWRLPTCSVVQPGFAVGFDAGGILLAFVTKQRFEEIGPMKPPLAQFERVEHLAEQMGIVPKIAERLGAKPLPV